MRTRSPGDPQATIRVKSFRNIMKAYQRITLFATVLATAALPPLLRAQSNEPATPVEPVESPAADMQEIERKALLKQYDLALKERVAAEEAMLKVASPEPEYLILEQAYLKRAEWLEQVKDQLVAIDHVQNPKLAALTKKLNGVIPGPVAFEDKPIDEVLQFVERIIKQDDQIGSGLVVNVVLIDKDNQSPVTMSLENVTLHTVLKVAAQQADLTIHIEDEIISLRKYEHTKEEIAASLALWRGHKPEVGDLTYVLHRIRYPKIDYQDVSVQAMLDDVEYHLSNSRDARPDLQVPKFSFRGGEESKSTFSIKLGNATLYTVLNVVAEQAGLRLDIGKELISMRKPTGKQAAPASKTVWPSNHKKVTALTKKLDTIRIPEAAFEDATIHELVEFLRTRGKELDPDKTGVNLALMDEDNESTVTFRLENATMHTILKIAAEQAGLALHIGEDAVSLRHPKDTEISELATDKPEDEEKDAELAFYENTYGKKISGVLPKRKYPHSREYYAAILEQLGLRDIILKAADANFGTGDKNGPELRTLTHVGPSPIADKPGWYIIMECRPAQSEQEKAASQRRLIIRKLHLDYEGNVAFLEEIPAWEQAPDKPKEKKKDEELAFYEKTYGKEISGVWPKSKYENPDEFYAAIADELGLRDIILKAADAKFGSEEENGLEHRILDAVRPSADANKPGWVIVMSCYTPKPKHENVDSAKKVMVQLLHLDYQGNVTFLDRMPK